MNVGITVWNGRISPVFDVARHVQVFATGNGRATFVREAELPGTDVQAQAVAVSALGVDALICGAISRPMAAALAALNIRLVPFAAGEAPSVLNAWLGGRLPDPNLCMPGCGRGQGRGRERRCRRMGGMSEPAMGSLE